MKIGRPLKKLPHERHGGRRAKYQAIYDAVDKLAEGDWLPIEFETRAEAVRAAGALRHRMTVSIHGNTVYCTRRSK